MIFFYANAVVCDSDSDRGIAHSVKAHQIPLASRIAKGVPLPQVLPIAGDQTITTILPVETATGAAGVSEETYLLLLTSKGYMKKTPLKAFKSIQARGLTIITLGTYICTIIHFHLVLSSFLEI